MALVKDRSQKLKLQMQLWHAFTVNQSARHNKGMSRLIIIWTWLTLLPSRCQWLRAISLTRQAYSVADPPVDIGSVTQVWVVCLLCSICQDQLDHLLGPLRGLLQEQLDCRSDKLQLHLQHTGQTVSQPMLFADQEVHFLTDWPHSKKQDAISRMRQRWLEPCEISISTFAAIHQSFA